MAEIGPPFSIECLDPVPPKPRLMPDQIIGRIKQMAILKAGRMHSHPEIPLLSSFCRSSG